jgi:uncharacterized protein YidB (DUF937 family)
MGLLGDILGKVVGGGGAGTEAQIMSAVASMLSDKQSGGLAGLVDQFSKNGLGDIVSSWVSTGKNLPISTDQIAKGLGSQQISQIASKVGLPADKVSSTLASILPGLVDTLTPNGKLPTDDLLQEGLSMLKGKLGR